MTPDLYDPTYIVEVMALSAPDSNDPGVDLDPNEVRLLISLARLAHERCLSDWLRTNEPAYMEPPSTGPYAKWENRRPKNPGRFRDGSDLPAPPLRAIYAICNEWWRAKVGTAFHCDFKAWSLGDDYTGLERLEFLNPAARLFLLIAGAVGEYTPDQCRRVHETTYKRLDKRIP